jgi:V-type H+-transporting ATPase subunit E
MEVDGEKQIGQMVSFILHEAKQKAAELESKGKEEYNITKVQMIREQREKIRKEYAAKLKRLETQQAIARSTMINQTRLKRVQARTAAFEEMTEGVKQKLVAVTQSPMKYKELLSALIVQGCLKLIEDKVQVRCREQDKQIVQSVLPETEKQYQLAIKGQTGVVKQVSLSVDTTRYLPATGKGAVLGGVVLACYNGLITVDNTLDARLQLVEEQDKPALREILFPSQMNV